MTPAYDRASRIYSGISRASTLAGLLRHAARTEFGNPVDADSFRNGVELVAELIETDLSPLLEAAGDLCLEAQAGAA